MRFRFPPSIVRHFVASAQPYLLHHIQNAGARQGAGGIEVVAALTFQAGYQLTHMSREVVSRWYFRHRAQTRVSDQVQQRPFHLAQLILMNGRGQFAYQLGQTSRLDRRHHSGASCDCVFPVVLLVRGYQRYPVARDFLGWSLRPAHRLGEILLVGLAEYRGHQVGVVTGEHEEHPQEYDEANGAGVHGHGVLGGAGSPRGNVAARLLRSAILDSLAASWPIQGPDRHRPGLDLAFEL